MVLVRTFSRNKSVEIRLFPSASANARRFHQNAPEAAIFADFLLRSANPSARSVPLIWKKTQSL
jgi:hypothetical protein